MADIEVPVLIVGSSLVGMSTALLLDQRNVLREKPDETTRAVGVHELHDGRGARIALRLLAIDPAQLPRTDFFKAASRYL